MDGDSCLQICSMAIAINLLRSRHDLSHIIVLPGFCGFFGF